MLKGEKRPRSSTGKCLLSALPQPRMDLTPGMRNRRPALSRSFPAPDTHIVCAVESKPVCKR